MAEQPSEAVQDYLKAIHRLGGANHVVSPADIALALGVKAPSVTGMLKRLAEASSSTLFSAPPLPSSERHANKRNM